MILYVGTKDSTKRILEPINKYSTVSGYRINIQKISSFSIY
jgi:hypothetical protein